MVYFTHIISTLLFSSILFILAVITQPLWSLVIHHRKFIYEDPLDKTIDKEYYPAIFCGMVSLANIFFIVDTAFANPTTSLLNLHIAVEILAIAGCIVSIVLANKKTALGRSILGSFDEICFLLHSHYPKERGDQLMEYFLNNIVPFTTLPQFERIGEYYENGFGPDFLLNEYLKAFNHDSSPKKNWLLTKGDNQKTLELLTGLVQES